MANADQISDEHKKICTSSTHVSYRKLGNCGLRVSVPILGTMSIGHKDWQPWVEDDQEKVNKLLKAAYDCGLNTWDTADVYSNGVTESMIGRAIKVNNIPRHKVVIMTKCFAPVGEIPAVKLWRFEGIAETKDYVNQSGLSRGAIFKCVDASLKRLQTDYIDLFQIHEFDHTVPIEETMKALHDVVQSGKVRYIGASCVWAYQFIMMQNVAEKNRWTKFVSVQNRYSLCDREDEREMNKYCALTGIGLIPWEPLHRGLLARPLPQSSPTCPPETERADALRQMKWVVATNGGRSRDCATSRAAGGGTRSGIWYMLL